MITDKQVRRAGMAAIDIVAATMVKARAAESPTKQSGGGDISTMFAQLDVDGDGSLTCAEIVKNCHVLKLSEEEAYDLFQKLDVDGDGELSIEEFAKAAKFLALKKKANAFKVQKNEADAAEALKKQEAEAARDKSMAGEVQKAARFLGTWTEGREPASPRSPMSPMSPMSPDSVADETTTPGQSEDSKLAQETAIGALERATAGKDGFALAQALIEIDHSGVKKLSPQQDASARKLAQEFKISAVDVQLRSAMGTGAFGELQRAVAAAEKTKDLPAETVPVLAAAKKDLAVVSALAHALQTAKASQGASPASVATLVKAIEAAAAAGVRSGKVYEQAFKLAADLSKSDALPRPEVRETSPRRSASPRAPRPASPRAPRVPRKLVMDHSPTSPRRGVFGPPEAGKSAF